MTNTVSPQLSDLYGALQPFIVETIGIDPSLVFEGLDNRVVMPPATPGFIAYQVIAQQRLNTNIKTWDPTAVNPVSISTEMHVRLTIQIDCYGPNSLAWATILQTLFRDETGCLGLAGPDPSNPVCQPLYADDPHMIALDDTEDQYEQRWSFDLQIQYNPIVGVATQFADTLQATPESVTVEFPT